MNKSDELLQVSKQIVLQEYKATDARGKSSFIKVFGAKHFIASIQEWEEYIISKITSFESACLEAGVDPNDDRFRQGEPDEISYRKGKLVCDVLNGPFIHLMKDTTSRKWYAWMEKTETGFRFVDSYFDDTNSSTSSGSRLRLCSEKLAKHFAITFTEMMTHFWWNE